MRLSGWNLQDQKRDNPGGIRVALGITHTSKPRHQVTAATERQGSSPDTSKPTFHSKHVHLRAAFSIGTNIPNTTYSAAAFDI